MNASDKTDKDALAIGARLSMRNTAREILAILDDLTEDEFTKSGWTIDEVAGLERLAGIRIEGWDGKVWRQRTE